MNPTRQPVACELFSQWRRARGVQLVPSVRPFSRRWEELLESAGLVSATERNDAERDARTLVVNGWLEIIPVRYKPYLIERIVMPLAAEPSWQEAFGFVPPSDEEARRIREFDWSPPLVFLRETRLNIPFAELIQLDNFFKRATATLEIIPIKERSLQIFGDEKRLDTLLASALFRTERLDLERDLRCKTVGEPLPWRRGPAAAAHQPMLIIENAATWHSYCRWNAERKLFSAVIYGCGNRFVDGVRYLADIFSELGGARPLFYFGDLDPQGLWIPQTASKQSQALGGAAIAPHLWSYRHLFEQGLGRAQACENELFSSTQCDWLGELAEPARQLFAANQRLAQEHIGWEFLRTQNI